MFKSEILFNGYYGQLNTGDDAFVEVTSWGAKNLWDKKDIRYLALGENLPKTVESKLCYPLTLPRSYKYQQRLLIDNADAFISAGGSTFHSVLSQNNPKVQAFKRKKTLQDKFKLGAIGISLGPFQNKEAEKSIEKYLKSLDFLTLRDKRSYEYAKSLNLPYEPIDAFDLAALLPKIYRTENFKSSISKLKTKTIGISLCNYERFVNKDKAKEERRNKKLLQLIQNLDRKLEVHFKFFVINGNPKNGDLSLTLETINNSSLKNTFEVYPYNPSTAQTWGQIVKCDFMISTRLHGGIFACFADTPFMLVEYHQKCTDFLADIGYNNDYRLYDAEFDINRTVMQIQTVMENHYSYERPSNIRSMIEKAYLNFNTIEI